jgi:hypothetical protein
MNAYFTLDFDDLLAFQKDVITTSYTHTIKKKYFKWISAALLFLLSLLLVKNTFQTFVVVTVAVVLYFFIFPFLYHYVAGIRLKSQLQKNDYSHVLGECKVTISDDGIHREIHGTASHFKWTDFEKMHEDSGHYYLYVSDLQGLILRKTPDNLNAEETTLFNRLIKDNTEKN